MEFANIVDGVVANIIVAEPDVIASFPGEWVDATGLSIGMRLVAKTVSMRQARLALLSAGLLDDVNAGISTLGQAAQIEWEYASEVRRDSALVVSMGQLLGMDDAALDALFLHAAAL